MDAHDLIALFASVGGFVGAFLGVVLAKLAPPFSAVAVTIVKPRRRG